MDARHIHHTPAVNARDRIGPIPADGRVVITHDRLKRARLHEVVAKPSRERRQGAFGRLRINKNIRRIGAPIHRRTTDFGQPEGLALRNPGGGLRKLPAAAALHMRVGPPAQQILGAIDPGLAIGAIGDGAALLGGARCVVSIIPVITLASRQAAAQIAHIINRGCKRCVRMVRPITPIRQWEISVNTNKIDIGGGPDHIQRKPDLRAAIQHMSAIFRPVGAIGHLDADAKHALHIARQQRQRIRRRINAKRRAHARQRGEFRTYQKSIHATRLRAKPGAMQNEAPIAPISRTRRGGAEEAGDLRRRARRRIGGTSASGRGIAGDPPTPGICRLRGGARPGIGQAIIRRHIHHHEGIKNHRKTARLQVAYGGDHRIIGRRAAHGRPAIHLRDDASGGARQSRHAPGRVQNLLHGLFDARRYRAMTRAQIIAEPGDDKRDAGEIGTQRLQCVQRGDPIAGAEELMTIFGRRDPRRRARGERANAVTELGRAGNKINAADHGAQPLNRLHNLEGELRHTIAIISQREPLEHNIGETAISGRMIRALLCDDQWIGRLAFIAPIDPHVHQRAINLHAIRPHPAHKSDGSFAKPNREVGEIAVTRRLLRGCATAPNAAFAAGSATAGHFDLLFKARRPDDLPAQTHAPVNPGNGGALRGGEPRQRRQARAFTQRHGA